MLAGPVTVDGSDAGFETVSDDVFDAAIGSIEAANNAVRTEAASAAFKAFAADGGRLSPAVVTPVGCTTVVARSTKAISIQPKTMPLAASARWFTSSDVASPSTFTGAKIIYDAPGVLLIPQAALPAGFDIDHASVQREGRSLVPLAVTPDALVVFGPGYQDDYTGKDALFLRKTGGQTAAGQVTHVQGLFAAGQTVNTTTPATVTSEYHDVYFDYNLRPYTFAPWFSSQYLSADAVSGTTSSFSIDTPSASGGAATLTVNLWSLTENPGGGVDHALQVMVNGTPAGEASSSGGNTMLQLTFEVPSGGLNAGSNQIELITPAIDGVSSQISLLHSMTVAYTCALDGSKPVAIINPDITPNVYEVTNLPGADAWVVDARFPDRAVLVPFESQADGKGAYTLRFTATGGGTGQYQIVPMGQENSPVSVSKRQVKPMKSTAGIYWAVGPSQFSAGVQPLLAQRSKEGIRGTFVDQEQLFDYYNYGRYSPVAIQNAVRALRPQYLLLLGRTTYDYLNYSGLNVDPLCPTFLVSTSFWAQTTSDSTFGDMGRGYPEVAVGRLPVNNPDELSAAVTHVLNYTGAPESGVRVQAVADLIDPEVADFPSQAAAMAQTLPDMIWQPNYLGVTYSSAPDVTTAMAAAANGGADWILYVGHGNASRLGKNVPRILDVDGVQAWNGNVVFIQSTCTANWAAPDSTVYISIALQALIQPQGGISASIASSTYMNSDYATDFMSHLMNNAAAGSGMRWGNALMKTQQWAAGKGAGFYSDLNRTEQIFGDPAMPVFKKSAPNANTGKNTTGAAPATGTF